ncbi:hypothetical protein LBMAG42_40200 [Deltaproteobacteria bacterium]|nr:hypothetical protein LBMAG42_40200 [Deltaproteobacteria bacterium]
MFLLLGCLTAPEPADSPVEARGSNECAACVTWYADADGDGFGDDAATTCACEASAAFPAEVGGDCDDHEAKASPASAELCGDWADNDCDALQDEDGAVDCVPAWLDGDGDGFGAGDERCACLGEGLAALDGDCDDGDGSAFPGAGATDGVPCGRDEDDDGYADATPPVGVDAGTDCDDRNGAVNPAAEPICRDGVDQSCDGGSSCRIAEQVLEADAGLRAESGGDYDRLGTALVACDLDRDGADEVIVGAGLEGDAWMLPSAPWESITELRLGAGGDAVACADVDGDGLLDILGGDDDQVRVRPGSGEADWTLSVDGNGWFGVAISDVGDVDGDGQAEIAVGNHPGRGAVWRVGAGGHTVEPWFRGTRSAAYFGRAVASPGDVDGDGLADVLIGAYGEDDYAGAARIFLGGSLDERTDDDADAMYAGAGRDYAGFAVTGGDLDADGYADLVIGSGFGSNVWIVRGSASLASVELAYADARLTGRNVLGSAVHATGDVDKDGFGDLLVSAPDAGAVWWVPGAATLVVADVEDVGVELGGGLNDSLGTALTSGDVDGDGWIDLVISAPDLGGGVVYAVFGSGM